jgi:hypothetical protein
VSREARREKGRSGLPVGNVDRPFARLGGVCRPLPDTLLPSAGPAPDWRIDDLCAKGDYFQAKSAPSNL